MKEELGQVDYDLKNLFVAGKFDDMKEILKQRIDPEIKELSEYNWGIIKKYYDTERFDLLFSHFKFVAYSCYIVEYTHQRSLISDEAFKIMMMIYNDLYEMKRQQK